MLINVLLIVVSLGLLTLGAEWLVRGASALALRLGLSSFFVGLTIVGFGTSTPELATSINAGLNQLSDISLGNIVGSNIFNLALILGLTAMIAPIPVNTEVVRRQVYIMIAAAFVPYLALLSGGVLTRPMGFVMIAGLVAFLVYGYRMGKAEKIHDAPVLAELEDELGVLRPSIYDRTWVCLGAIGLGLAALVFGSDLLIGASVEIGRALGVSELAIGLTVVAAGTSMPELFTSAVAALRKQSDIAIGNIVGSCIFNILGIGGITAALYPQTVSPALLSMHLPFMIALSIASLPIMMTGKRISRAEGTVFLGCYVLYTVLLFTLAPQWFPDNP